MTEYKGIEYMRRKLSQKKSRVKTRYDYYEMKNTVKDMSRMTPPDMRWLTACLGWCGKAVDSIADRIIFREFIDDNFDINEIFQMNNPDTLFDSAISSALIASCSFIYISPDEDGYPRMQVIDGANATGIMDPITGLLTEGYAILEKDNGGTAIQEAYFVPFRTDYIKKGEKDIDSRKSNVPYPLLVPIINRPDAVRPFGHSRISRACINIMQSALRTIKRSEISAEFYSFPQKYILGMSQDAEMIDKWQASMSSMLAFTKDAEGDKPEVGQFTQQSMSPYVEHFKMFAAMFAGETGLTMDDLGFVSDNPSSADAIKAAHETQRLIARKAQRNFSTGLINAGYLAACMRDNFAYKRRQIYLTKAAWEPIYEPDAAMLSSIGDGAIKINQAIPGYFNEDNLRNLTGIKASGMPMVAPVNTDIPSATILEKKGGINPQNLRR